MKRLRDMTPETLMLAALLVASVLALIFMSSLVAPPKLLFGRALSAIPPSLFPTIIIAAIVVLTVLVFLLRSVGQIEAEPDPMKANEWKRGAAFFGIMLLYALTMQPVGFLISSIIAISLLSYLMGNRSILLTAVMALLGPILLYLAATRLLAVSLPELNLIELAYARLLGE